MLSQVHRDPRYFYPDPECFRPDRWLEPTSDSILDQSAYFPFSYGKFRFSSTITYTPSQTPGPTSCAGKSLALLEIRMVVCSLIQNFEFELSPSFNYGDWESNLQDCFILVKGELPVRIQVRKL